VTDHSTGQEYMSTHQDVIQELRLDLAAGLRWAARHNLHEGVDNHFSIAVPDEDGISRGERFLINPYGWHWSEITASCLVYCDKDGNVLEGENWVEDTAFHIHSKVHITKPDAKVVLHTHQPYATAICTRKNGRLQMAEQNALMFKDRIAYDDTYNGLAADSDEGERIAHTMGNRSVGFLAGHGVVVCGGSMAEAYTDLYYLERAAMFQIMAGSNGGELNEVAEDVQTLTAQQMADDRPLLTSRHFNALRRILDKEEPEYRH
jgi:ribulose-5-phosphate 4-epimerase/fuculose-1-phosphate aldolase